MDRARPHGEKVADYDGDHPIYLGGLAERWRPFSLLMRVAEWMTTQVAQELVARCLGGRSLSAVM